MRISELANRSGVSARMLRHYDRIGLVSPSGRTEAGYREYSQADAWRLFQVESLRSLGLGLAEVREAHRRAVGMGATVKRCVSHGNAWSVYIEDPEGNVVEVYTHTPWYLPQPHLDLIDINKSDEDIYRETEALCRKDPAFCTREEWVARTTERLKK